MQAGFLTYEHRAQPADIVYSRWALHHLSDFWKSVALRRMRSWLPLPRSSEPILMTGRLYSVTCRTIWAAWDGHALGWACPVTVAHALVLQAADDIVPSKDDDRVACTTDDFLSEGQVTTSAVGVPRGGYWVSGP